MVAPVEKHKIGVVSLEEQTNSTFYEMEELLLCLGYCFSVDKSANVRIIPRSQTSQWEHTIQLFCKLGKDI
jgi:hypothetical protein